MFNLNNMDKLIREFGCTPISQELIDRFEQVSGHRAHPFLRRGFFCAHRDLDEILNDYEQKKPIYIYTGRGPSAGSFHLGHLIPFLFTKYLQDVFDAHVVIQITDDEKFLFRGTSFEELKTNTESNIKDIIACGFNPNKTFIFNNLDYIGIMYKNIIQIQDKLTTNQVQHTFGMNGSDSIGKLAFVATQAAPALSSSFPHLFQEPAQEGNCPSRRIRCLVPQGIDQDPYFRLTRDVCPKLGFPKPSLIHSSFVPSLKGVSTKMSSTEPEGAIFLTDTPKEIKKKIMRSVSGGLVSKEDQKRIGSDLTQDVAYQYLRFFLEDEEELKNISLNYGDEKSLELFGYDPNEYIGVEKMLTGDLKKIVIKVLSECINKHQIQREEITNEIIKKMIYRS